MSSLALFRVEIGSESPSRVNRSATPSQAGQDVDKEEDESMPEHFKKKKKKDSFNTILNFMMGLDETTERRTMLARELVVLVLSKFFLPSFLLTTQENLLIFGLFSCCILFLKMSKHAKNAYLTVFRGSMPPDPPEKRGLRPRKDRFAINCPDFNFPKLACMYTKRHVNYQR